MSSNETWRCGDCFAVLQAKRTATRHWKDAQAAGRGHQGPPNIIHQPGGPVPVASVVSPAPPVPSAPAAVLPPPPPPPPSAPLPFFPHPSLPQPTGFGGNRTDAPLQLRSSRSTRNQDHQVGSRNRPGVVDLDPTEGLPVQKWAQVPVRINQEPSVDPASVPSQPSGTTLTTSPEWAAQFNTPQFPWPERSLPSFFSQLPPHNQEMIRRARAGNTNPILSTWNSKTNSWNSGAEAELRRDAMKSGRFTNQDSNNGTNRNTAPESPPHYDDDDEHEEKSDNDSDGEHGDDASGSKDNGVKRRKKYVQEERTFEAKRWVQVPTAVADKTEERKFLADRRPGMPSLYGGAYQNQVFGSMGLNTNGYGFSAANAGYDLGDGGGLANAGGLTQSNEGAATPVRRNVPPKRKKKKGGPGRKKANPDTNPHNQASNGINASAEGQNFDESAIGKLTEDITMGEGDNDGSDSGSEAEGSEEGEIDEGGHDHDKQDGTVTHDNKIQEDLNIANEISTVGKEVDDTMMTGGTSVEVIQDSAKAIDGASDFQPDTRATVDQPPTDVIMHDIQPEEIQAQLPAETEAEVTQAVIQPLETDQSPTAQLPEADPISVHEIVSEPAPTLPTLAEQTASLTQSEIPAGPVPSVVDVPSSNVAPVQEAPRLSPIPTAIAESIDRPLVSVSDSDAATTIDPAAPAQVQGQVSTSNADALPALTSSQVAIPVPAPPPVTTTVDAAPSQSANQEPTSPDLLGGLEDELNKNMGEQKGE